MGSTEEAAGERSSRAVSFAAVAEQNPARIALDRGGEPVQSGNQLPGLADEGPDIAQGLLTEGADARTRILQCELKLSIGVGQVLGKAVEIGERRRRPVA